MKVLFVTHRYPPHTGGIETHVKQIATRVANRGHEVTVFSADAGSEADLNQTEDGVRIRRFRSVSPNGAFHIAPQLAPAVRRAEADVVHAHNYHSFPLFFAALGVTNEQFVVTTHYHGESASNFRDWLLAAYRPMGKWSVRRADEVIAVSDWEHDRLQTDFGVGATTIPNGLDITRFSLTEPEQRDRPYLLCVGRLEEYKGVQHVIRAMPNVPGYDLVVAGRGPYREELERVASAEGVADRVEFLGYASDDRLPRLYAGAELYVTLSEFEAYGMTVAEALAAGTPCVVRESGALVDWAERSDCFGVETVDPAVVGQAIREGIDQNAPTDRLPTWDDVTDRVLARYG